MIDIIQETCREFPSFEVTVQGSRLPDDFQGLIKEMGNYTTSPFLA